MTPQQLEAAEAMYRALKLAQCSCQHNVLYAGMKVDQFVTVKCSRCKAIQLWELANQSTPREK